MRIKKSIGALSFFAMVSLLIFLLTQTFHCEQKTYTVRFASFYREPKKTIDILYYGTSAADRFWNPTIAWYEHGMTSYLLSTNRQSFVYTKYLIEESLKHQSPKLLVIDIRNVCSEPDEMGVIAMRSAPDVMPFSWTRFKAVHAALKWQENPQITEHAMSYYFSFMLYHSRWDDMRSNDFKGQEAKYKGFYYNKTLSFQAVRIRESENHTGKVPLHPKCEAILSQLLDYIDSLGIEALFVASQATMKEEDYGQLNSAFDIIKQRGYNTLDFTKPELNEEMGINYETDFYDSDHVNAYGSTKFTGFLSAFIDKTYDIPDRRSEESGLYSSWDEEFNDFYKLMHDQWLDIWDKRYMPS